MYVWLNWLIDWQLHLYKEYKPYFFLVHFASKHASGPKCKIIKNHAPCTQHAHKQSLGCFFFFGWGALSCFVGKELQSV